MLTATSKARTVPELQILFHIKGMHMRTLAELQQEQTGTVRTTDRRAAYVGRTKSTRMAACLLPAKDCPELAAGFAAILTDFINTTLGGCAPDPKFYEPKIEGGGQAAA